MTLIGAAPSPRGFAEDPLPGVANYYSGKDPSKWRRNVPSYRRVKYHDIYPGIDLSYRGDKGMFEFDFELKPGADSHRLAIHFGGLSSIHSDPAGNLVVQLNHRELTLKRPIAYQNIGGARRIVAASYEPGTPANSKIRIALGKYDHAQPLTIDPAVVFSTYFGGTLTKIPGSAVDSSGNVYVTGFAYDRPGLVEFPTTIGQAYDGNSDAFVSKISADGTTLLWSTLIGGSQFDLGKAVAVDGAGNAYVAGETFSTDFPVTTGPNTAPGGGDAFVAKFAAANGAVAWATYLGGTNYDESFSIALPQGCSSNCNAFVAGDTDSPNFPGATGFVGSFDARLLPRCFRTEAAPSIRN